MVPAAQPRQMSRLCRDSGKDRVGNAGVQAFVAMLLIVTNREDFFNSVDLVQKPMVKIYLQIDVEHVRCGHEQHRQGKSMVRIVDHFLLSDFAPGAQQIFDFVERLAENTQNCAV
jgi:hypothetical protein